MIDWAFDFDSALFEHRRSTLDVRFINREGEVLQRPIAFVFLKHDHPGIASCSEKQPVAIRISYAVFQFDNRKAELFGLLKFFHSNRDFIYARYRKHILAPWLQTR